MIAAWFAALAFASTVLAAPKEFTTKVAVIGGGAAGLQAIDQLRQAGIPALGLEATDRFGGRIYSRPDISTSLGLVLDEGANLINSTDRVALSLLDRYSIPYVRRIPKGQDHMVYVFGTRVFTQAQLEALLFSSDARTLWSLAKDQAARAKGTDSALMARLTKINIEDYLRGYGASPILVGLLRSFFWSEYGKRLENLNGHVLHDYFALDCANQHFKLIPYTDEAFTVPSGTGQIAAHLAADNAGSLLLNHRVTSVQSQPDGRVLIEASTPDGPVRVRADYVLYAAPLYRLKDIQVDVEGLDSLALSQARLVTYAKGVKLHLKFRPGFYDIYKFPGIYVTDTGEQIWISSFGQPGGAGLLTVLTGPMPATEGANQTRVTRVLSQLELLAPGVTAFYEGYERTDAPFSYSGALEPGETNDLKINADHGRWITIGEASGGSLQGYLEGALASATRRTQRLISRIQSGSEPCGTLLESPAN